ncbi:MAG: hypothetical protein H0V66_10480 [Bdellovibrionales bacterium]|nr:hypothetical protein [Bdellovibrionales bacterium]
MTNIDSLKSQIELIERSYLDSDRIDGPNTEYANLKADLSNLITDQAFAQPIWNFKKGHDLLRYRKELFPLSKFQEHEQDYFKEMYSKLKKLFIAVAVIYSLMFTASMYSYIPSYLFTYEILVVFLLISACTGVVCTNVTSRHLLKVQMEPFPFIFGKYLIALTLMHCFLCAAIELESGFYLFFGFTICFLPEIKYKFKSGYMYKNLSGKLDPESRKMLFKFLDENRSVLGL